MKCSKERLDPDILFYETGKAVIKEVAVDVAIGAVTAGVGGLALKAGVKAAPYLGRFGMYAVNGVRKAVGFEKAGRVESEIAASGNTAGVGLKASADSLVGAESAQRMVRIEKTIQMIEEYMGERMKVTKPGVQGKSDLILTSADGTKK